MTKKEVAHVVKLNEEAKTETLKEAIATLVEMKEERELTRVMYFWRPYERAKDRRSNEERRNIRLEIKIEGLTVLYCRSYKENCRYVHASDRLWANEYDFFTLRDIGKLIEALSEMLKKRGKES